MKQCTALRKDGEQCHAKAVLRDPEGHCAFHTSLNSLVTKKTHDLTKAEAARMVTRELRRLRKMKNLDPLHRSNEIRSLIQLWQSLTAPEPEPVFRPMTYAEKVKMIESEGKTK